MLVEQLTRLFGHTVRAIFHTPFQFYYSYLSDLRTRVLLPQSRPYTYSEITEGNQTEKKGVENFVRDVFLISLEESEWEVKNEKKYYSYHRVFSTTHCEG